jgi:PHP family Zn ribbon phosphoesterase
MQKYRADLHIHTLLSPCGSLDMDPDTIVTIAQSKGLDIIGITDHNHTGHCRLASEIASEKGIFVLCGAEVTTKEEAHCLAFFETFEVLGDFQQLLNQSLIKVKNKTDLFGHQVIIDRNEQILEEVEPLLINATTLSVDALAKEVHQRDGIFIPAHVNRSAYSLTSQLGFIPPDIEADALELSKHADTSNFRKENPLLNAFSIIRSSDAHFPEDIGSVHTLFNIEKPSFQEIKMALLNTGGRSVFS